MVHTSLARAYSLHGDAEQAAAHALAGFELDEKLANQRGVGMVAPILVGALAKLGKRDDALNYCDRALRIAPDNERLRRLRDDLSAPAPVPALGTVKRIMLHADGYRYGFIIPDTGARDVFFHESCASPECLDRLAEGVRVRIEVEQAPRGPRATRMRLAENQPQS